MTELEMLDLHLPGGRIHNAETMAGFIAADRRNMTGRRHKDGRFPFTTSRGRFGLGDYHKMRSKI